MIETWFLILALLFPRISLLLAYCVGSIPVNTVPFILDIIGAVFVPRFLISFYIYGLQGASVWFWAHLIFAIVSLLSGTARVSANRS